MSEIGIWITVLATLAIYSFLYRDNPFYRAAEYLLVGLTIGYSLVISVKTVLWPSLFMPLFSSDIVGIILIIISWVILISSFFLLPMLPVWLSIPIVIIIVIVNRAIMRLYPNEFANIIPLILGGMMLVRLVPKLTAWSRIPLAVIVGAGAGVSIPAMLKARVLQQMGATITNVPSINGIIMLIGVIATILYFYFSRERKGFLTPVAKIGTYYMMVFFGATFGYTVMSRVSLLIGRMEFLLGDWLRLIPQ